MNAHLHWAIYEIPLGYLVQWTADRAKSRLDLSYDQFINRWRCIFSANRERSFGAEGVTIAEAIGRTLQEAGILASLIDDYGRDRSLAPPAPAEATEPAPAPATPAKRRRK